MSQPSELLKKTDRPPPLAIPRKEVARVLGLSLSTVDRAIGRGDLKAKKYGARVLVPVAEVERFEASIPTMKTRPA